MNKDEALLIALEALVDFGWHIENCPQFPTWAEPKKHPPCTCGYDTAITALRQALEQEPWDTTDMAHRPNGLSMEQEPVAKNEVMEEKLLNTCINCKLPRFDSPVGLATPQCKCMWMQNTPPTVKPWVGLTDDEVFTIWMKSPAETEDRFAFVKAVMKELKEKNT